MAIIYKNKDQIENIRFASQVLGEIHHNLKSMIDIGMTLNEIDRLVESTILKHKGRPSFKGFHGFPNAACISLNNIVIHGIPTNYRLKDGDIVGVDIGMDYKGGYGDTAYTYLVGNVSQSVKKLCEITEKSLYAAIDKCHVGNRIGDISNAVEAFVAPYGYGIVREYCGHGVGTDVWEEPEIPNYGKAGRGPRLKENMVIAIEPMVTLGTQEIYVKDDGWSVSTKDHLPSAHYEHTILISANGPEILTEAKKYDLVSV